MKLYGFFLRDLIKKEVLLNEDINHPTDAEVIILEEVSDADGLKQEELSKNNLDICYVRDILIRIQNSYGSERDISDDDGGYVMICKKIWEAEKFLQLGMPLVDRAETFTSYMGYTDYTVVINNETVVTVLVLDEK